MILQEARIFVARFVKGDHTPEEYATFLHWLEKASTEELEVIAGEYEALFGDWSIPAVTPSKEWIAQLEAKLDLVDEENAMAPVVKMDRSSIVRKMVVKLAAASVVLAVGVSSYLWFVHQNGQKPGVSDNNAGIPLNAFSVPKGGVQREFVLPDGSKVWLNAATTLKYPVAFNSPERLVELNGEAYFEISKDAKLPFRIKIGATQIEVLGTQFNVQAYEDEPFSRTTLVDGSVRVSKGGEAVVLHPGEQAEVSNGLTDGQTAVKVNRDVNLDGIISWRGGIMEFNNDDLHVVMQKISRAYNFGLEFEQGIPERRFTGLLNRKSSIEQIFKQLELQQIHCTLKDGKTIVVMH